MAVFAMGTPTGACYMKHLARGKGNAQLCGKKDFLRFVPRSSDMKYVFN